ncbi:carbamoyltransferase HypF [Planotetraspora kaengkrachanensis]|uniref:Carbamoyltransferase n=1 Tax=Planotetraspora kaengkrachanensis TaxID=575193 RepID=A0A8J3PX14_9ACTN|nr:carbamoyltransferase HypF [Planotetraspora kaengkrachanensis]GIG82711.1 carbamoyltransferase [Planotetraspora kaengkrachanensis]
MHTEHTEPLDGPIRRHVRVEGVVQGVGFRPFVYGLATRLGLAGRVGNDAGGVFVEVEGMRAGIDAFLAALRRDAPPLAEIERVTVRPGDPDGAGGFTIVDSDGSGPRQALVSPDSATCGDCLTELADPADRRFRYPFINCTNCGPRFTIVRDVPYDRPNTTMAAFPMCSACAAEYGDPGDRRFHAQPISCWDCGPRLRLTAADGTELPGDPVREAAALLRGSGVVAIKGLGGYHLAVRVDDETAASTLRARKHREDKPFAVMVPDVETAAALCEVDESAVASLTGRARPIVLLPRRDAPAGRRRVVPSVARAVAPGDRRLGLMLPYTPVHHLLLAELGTPIVLTSGNVSDEPIAYDDADALGRLAGIADAFLVHDRPIHIRTDDSVVRPFLGRESVLRRSRGHVPDPVRLSRPARRPILACGAELKNTFCLVKGRHAFVSHHIGDLENYETMRSFVTGIDHFTRLFDVRPELVAHDLHPEYLSTKHALAMTGVDSTGVQHHHAHIASCLADNGEEGPVLGVAFDGLGYGADGTIWGGEFLLADLVSFQRLGHLAPVPMPGGTAAIRQPWRMAAAYLDAAYGGRPPQGLDVVGRNQAAWADVLMLGRTGMNSPATSSAGRLFDAVSALLGLRDTINYEGQAAVELEQHADPAERGAYHAGISAGRPVVVAGADLVRAAAQDVLTGVEPGVVAARFHNGAADVVVRVCEILREESGVSVVALSGGVFQNQLLLVRVAGGLTASGFRVLTHARVPPNDGGISVGQAAVAAARDRLA